MGGVLVHAPGPVAVVGLIIIVVAAIVLVVQLIIVIRGLVPFLKLTINFYPSFPLKNKELT